MFQRPWSLKLKRYLVLIKNLQYKWVLYGHRISIKKQLFQLGSFRNFYVKGIFFLLIVVSQFNTANFVPVWIQNICEILGVRIHCIVNMNPTVKCIFRYWIVAFQFSDLEGSFTAVEPRFFTKYVLNTLKFRNNDCFIKTYNIEFGFFFLKNWINLQKSDSFGVVF